MPAMTQESRKAAGAEEPTVYEAGEQEGEPLAIRMPVDIRSVTLTTIAALAVILVLQFAEAFLIPVVLGILISYVLGPAVTSMARHGVPRALGAFVVIAALCGSAGFGAYTLTDEAVDIIDDLPRAAQKFRNRIRASRTRSADQGFLSRVQSAATEIDRAAATATDQVPTAPGITRVQVVQPTFSASDYLWLGGRGALRFLAQFTIVMFLVYFLLVSDDLYKRKIVKIAGPTLSKKKISVQIMDEINQQISGFLRVQVITSAIVAVATGFALWWFGVENYVVWGLLAGIFNSIPYLGPIVVTGGLAAVTFMQFDDLVRTAYVSGTALAITSVEGWVLTPLLMSRAARMNPVAIFVGLLFWSWVWGVWGAILAVPMLTTLKAICDRVEDLQPVGEMLGE
jgi:predicted PurR-regulated permease PerM